MHLILVHIGAEFPPYVNDCLQQVRCVSNIPIVVLMEPALVDLVLPLPDMTVVPLDALPVDWFQQEYLRTCRLDPAFRGGFWRAATLRFFYVHAYAKMHQLHDIFHIEYDNLIYMDFTKLLPAFQTRRMMCVMDAPDRGIASFVYWRDVDALFDFLLSCLNAGSRGDNDMVTLARHAYAHGDTVGWLPIITPDYLGVDPRYSERVAEFGALFDGAAVGQYIGGVDPRNTPGDTRGFVNETTVFKCDKATLEWRVQDGLRRPFLNDTPLVNLHIHSKDLKRWMGLPLRDSSTDAR
jgi:hypothetical protein